jgi:heme-degrading monooxygenase HmoA
MFARVARGKVRPGTWEEYGRLHHEEILPATRNVEGLHLRELLGGTDDPDEGISLTLWERREDLDAYNRARACYVREYWVKHFDVRLGEARRTGQTGGSPEEALGGWQSPVEAGPSQDSPA